MKQSHLLGVLGICALVAVVLATRFMAPKPQSSPTPQETAATNMVHSFTITDEKSFLESMIPHHQEAVDTSLLIVNQTTRPELKAFAEAVVNAQTTEISDMKKYLLDWYQVTYQANGSYEPMMGNLQQSQGAELEKSYIEGMIVHHQGAIEMAKKVLELNPRPEIQKLAENIVATQEKEIATLRTWLGGEPSGHSIQVH